MTELQPPREPGYRLEHDFGRGLRHLCVLPMHWTMPAFLIPDSKALYRAVIARHDPAGDSHWL